MRYLKNGVGRGGPGRCAIVAPSKLAGSGRRMMRWYSAGSTVSRSGAGSPLAAQAAGIEGRITGHSGRVGLASELTARGASTTETMLAGGWQTARMVAHYSAGAAAELGAVAKYL